MGRQSNAALLVAAVKNDVVLVKRRLAEGADVNARSREGGTALYEAIRHGNRPMVALLLDAGADVNLAHRDGYTPLWLAVSKRHVPTVKQLLKHGARVSPAAIEAAVERRNATIVRLLLATGAKVSGLFALQKAARAGSATIVTALLEAGLGRELEKKDPNGWTPLLAAITNRQWAIAQMFIAAGAKVHSKVGRFRPLELAFERGGAAAVRQLTP